MSNTKHIVCPSCSAVNRTPVEKIDINPACGKCHKPLFNGKTVKLTSENFQKQISRSDIPVVVDFWAPWCGPCRMVGPVVEELATEYEGKVKVGKLNIDENQEVAQKYGIMSIPTLVVFKNGEVVEQILGAQPKEAIASAMDKAL